MAHVFVSYMHADEPVLAPLFSMLRQAGIDLWIDREEILGGSFWKADIRRAIESGAYFLCCFSEERMRREISVAHDELLIAIEQLRARQFGKRWFIAVRIDHCEIPEVPIFGDQTLRSLQWIDLFADMAGGTRRILQALDVDSNTIEQICNPRREGTKSDVDAQAAYRRWLAEHFSRDARHARMILSSCLKACEMANGETGLPDAIQKQELADTRQVLTTFTTSLRSIVEFYSPHMNADQFKKSAFVLENFNLIERYWRYVTDDGELFSGDHDEECLEGMQRCLSDLSDAVVDIGEHEFRSGPAVQ